VRDMIRKDIIDEAQKQGVTIGKVFQLLKRAEELGEAKGDGKILIALAKEYAAIIGMNATMSGKLPPPAQGELPGAEDAYDEIIQGEQKRQTTNEA